jgi:hypothetical protein
MNTCRERGWLDPPPADYKWAVVTVHYKAPKDPMDRFATIGSEKNREPEA